MVDVEVKWFIEVKVNIIKNCIDRYLSKRGEKMVIIFELNNFFEDVIHIIYNELYERVFKMVNVLCE